MRRLLLAVSFLALLAGCLSGEGYIVIEARGEGSDLPELPDPHGPDQHPGHGDDDMGGMDTSDAGAGGEADSGAGMGSEPDSGAGMGPGSDGDADAGGHQHSSAGP